MYTVQLINHSDQLTLSGTGSGAVHTLIVIDSLDMSIDPYTPVGVTTCSNVQQRS